MKKNVCSFRIFAFVVVLLLSSCQPSTGNNTAGSVFGDGSFTVDEKYVTDKVLNDLGAVVKDFHADNIAIQSVKPVGDEHQKVYFVQLTDSKRKQMLSRFLFLRGESFYFYEDLDDPKVKDETMFYVSYYSVTGTEEDECYPNIAYTEGELYWTTGNELVCKMNSPCVSKQHILIQ